MKTREERTDAEQEAFVKEQKREERERILRQGYEANLKGITKKDAPYTWVRYFDILWCDGWDLAEKEKQEFIKKNFVPSYSFLEKKSVDTEYLEPIIIKGVNDGL